MNMEEQLSNVPAEGSASESGQAEKSVYDRLYDENQALLAELERVRADIQIREDREKGRIHLKELVGKSDGPLFEKALKKAEMAELTDLPYEKRYELGYLICLGEEAHKTRFDGPASSHPPRFASSAGNGQVVLSAENRPTTFAMAKENAKRYLNLKH